MYRLVSLEPERRVHLHIRVPYMTQWGQHLVLVGSGALLGNFSVSKVRLALFFAAGRLL